MVSVTPRPRSIPGKMTPGTHWTGDWVGPRAGLDTQARGKSFALPGIEFRSSGRPDRSQTLLTELPRLQIHYLPQIKYNTSALQNQMINAVYRRLLR
jgi:hypothetical protein